MDASVNLGLLERVRAQLPDELNAGILFGERGACVLGFMLMVAGFHPIALYGSTIAVVDPARGGPAVQVVADIYGLDPTWVSELAELNDRTEAPRRAAAVRARLDELIASARRGA
jgi:hypothetical protein